MQTKKLLGAALVLAVSTASANAELLKGLKWQGQLDWQATAARNVTDFRTNANPVGTNGNDRVGDMQTRVLLGATWNILDDVSAQVTLRKNDRTWGTAGGTVQAGTNAQPVGTAGANILGTIYVDQAYAKIDKLGGAVDATLGRQFYGESGDMVIFYGPSDKALYGLPVFSLDAARFDWSNDMVGLTGIVGKQTGHALGVAAAVDTDIQGLNVALKGMENLSAGGYVYRVVNHNIGALGTPPSIAGAGGVNSFLWIAGVKAKAMLGQAAWIGGEIAKNFGTQRQADVAAGELGSRNLTGWAFKADAGMKAEVSGVGSLMPWAHFALGSGDADQRDGNDNAFTAINGDYRPGTIYGRFSDVSGAQLVELGENAGGAGVTSFRGNGTLTNRQIWGGGVKVAPGAMQKLTVGVSFWDFRSQRGINPSTGGSPRPFSGNKHIGSEFDLDLTWKHSDNVSLGAGAASFQPGGAIKEAISPAANGGGTQAGNNPVQLAYFDVRVKWGN